MKSLGRFYQRFSMMQQSNVALPEQKQAMKIYLRLW